MQSEWLSRRPIPTIFVLALVIHALLFLYDCSVGFAPFVQGDRSYVRFEIMQEVLAALPAGGVRTLAYSGVIPGEFLFQLPFYVIAGKAGVVLFQIALTILSVIAVAKIATSLFGWRYAAFTAGLAYLLLPQNLVFAHQMVTEATATPFCVFFLYCMHRYLKGGELRHAIYGGIWLGLAIFIRPSLALVIPALLGFCAYYRIFKLYRPSKGLPFACAIAVLPLAVWMAIFTSVTGHVGYTNGVANLGWNLRSKTFLAANAYGFEKPKEVKRFKDYEDLYADSDGISVGRFFTIAREHPVAFIKAALTDAAIVFGKGNSTKLTVDYFGIARDSNIKDWRNVLEEKGASGLIRWAMARVDMLAVFAFEVLWSIVVLVASLTAIALTIIWLAASRRLLPCTTAKEFGFLLIVASLLISVLASAEMVDRAQARLRHPAEAAMILLLGYVSPLRKRINNRKRSS
jgi:hypothetical protein